MTDDLDYEPPTWLPEGKLRQAAIANELVRPYVVKEAVPVANATIYRLIDAVPHLKVGRTTLVNARVLVAHLDAAYGMKGGAP
jgi:hypothetical protein